MNPDGEPGADGREAAAKRGAPMLNDQLMVRRLPVLQSSPPADPPLGLGRAVLLVVPAVLLVWAVLLWPLQRFGTVGAAVAYVLACGVGAGVLGHRVAPAQRRRFAALGAPITALCVGGLAVFSGVFSRAEIAVAALSALLGLGATGFALGIFVLFRRQRAAARLRH